MCNSPHSETERSTLEFRAEEKLRQIIGKEKSLQMLSAYVFVVQMQNTFIPISVYLADFIHIYIFYLTIESTTV